MSFETLKSRIPIIALVASLGAASIGCSAPESGSRLESAWIGKVSGQKCLTPDNKITTMMPPEFRLEIATNCWIEVCRKNIGLQIPDDEILPSDTAPVDTTCLYTF